jgi:hypothetical protein
MRLFGAKEGIDADNNRKEEVQLHFDYNGKDSRFLEARLGDPLPK